MGNTHTNIESTAFALMMQCPLTMDNSNKSCPFYNLRNEYVDVEAKLNYIESLSPNELANMIDTHTLCVDKEL